MHGLQHRVKVLYLDTHRMMHLAQSLQHCRQINIVCDEITDQPANHVQELDARVFDFFVFLEMSFHHLLHLVIGGEHREKYAAADFQLLIDRESVNMLIPEFGANLANSARDILTGDAVVDDEYAGLPSVMPTFEGRRFGRRAFEGERRQCHY